MAIVETSKPQKVRTFKNESLNNLVIRVEKELSDFTFGRRSCVSNVDELLEIIPTLKRGMVYFALKEGLGEDRYGRWKDTPKTGELKAIPPTPQMLEEIIFQNIIDFWRGKSDTVADNYQLQRRLSLPTHIHLQKLMQEIPELLLKLRRIILNARSGGGDPIRFRAITLFILRELASNRKDPDFILTQNSELRRLFDIRTWNQFYRYRNLWLDCETRKQHTAILRQQQGYYRVKQTQ